jgi:toxin ParE1/3/4
VTRKLVFSPHAVADLEEIFWFIAADNPGRAKTYVDEILKACRSLCETPLIGVDRSDLRPGVRILPFRRRIVIAYELPPNRVDVLRVFSGGQDYEAILGGD